MAGVSMAGVCGIIKDADPVEGGEGNDIFPIVLDI